MYGEGKRSGTWLLHLGTVSTRTCRKSGAHLYLYEFVLRSVHNVRIERLWRDLTAGVGYKWKLFFQDLECNGDLNPDVEGHMWLLHHLFLDAINTDLLEWAESWNSHVMTVPNQRQRSPKDMFFFGMLENGFRGFESELEEVEEEVDDLTAYGVDWEAIDDPHILQHHRQYNGADQSGNNPFVTHEPLNLSNVNVPEAGCPLTQEQVVFLDHQLNSSPFIRSRSMEARREVWILALQICMAIFSHH